MKVIGDPVQWYSEFPQRGLKKPGYAVHVGHLQSGPGALPCVGVVRGIFVDAAGLFGVRVAFPYNCGYIGAFSLHEVSGFFPAEWIQQGDWHALAPFRASWLVARACAGLPEPVGVWPAGYVPVPAQFYGWQ